MLGVSLSAAACRGPDERVGRSLPSAGAAVEFSSADGRSLRGRRYGSGNRWAVLVHDEAEDARAWSGLVRSLQAQGFQVLAFDRRGGAQARDDVAGALAFATSRGARRLYMVAAGTGASAALVAAGEYTAVRALVALSPRPTDLARPRRSSTETRAPKLIIVGSLNHRAARQADDIFRRSIGWAVLHSLPVDVQGTALLRSAWAVNVREQILGFLRDYFFD